MNPIRDEWTTDDGSVRLLLGDCLEILPTLAPGSVDAVVTDPPYAIVGGGASIAGKGTEEAFDTQFYQSWLKEQFSVLFPAMADSGALWWTSDWRGAMAAESALSKVGGWKKKARLAGVGVWDRGGLGMGYVLRKTYECFCVAVMPHWKRISADTPDVWRLQWTPGDRTSGHSAEKPVELFLEALKLIGGEFVVDPFVGSGTTAIACIRTGKRFVGIEKDESYFEIAKRRIREELSKTALLEATPKLVRRSFIQE